MRITSSRGLFLDYSPPLRGWKIQLLTQELDSSLFYQSYGSADTREKGNLLKQTKNWFVVLTAKKISIALRTRQLPLVSTSTLSGQNYESIWAIHSLRKSKKHPKTYFKWIKAQQGKQNRLFCRIELWWKRSVEIRNTLLLKTGKNLITKTEDTAKEFFLKKNIQKSF